MKLHKFCSLASANAAIAAAVLASSTCISAAVLPPELNWSTASAEVQVQGLAVQLVDLDPNDGITPQITFAENMINFNLQDGFGLDDYLHETIYRQADAATPLANTDILLQNPAGGSLVRMSAANLYAGVGTSESILSQKAVEDPTDTLTGLGDLNFSTPTDWVHQSSSGVVVGARRMVGYGGSSDDLLTWIDSGHVKFNSGRATEMSSFKLTPNTAVVFSGVLSSRIRLDVSQWRTYDPQAMQAIVNAPGRIEVYAAMPNDGKTAWSSLSDARAAIEAQDVTVGVTVNRYNFDPALMYGEFVPSDIFGPDSNFVELEDSKAFGLTFTNRTLQFKDGYFSADMDPYLKISGMTAVPEPATYTLMGLGLLGVLCAGRRRKA